MDDKLVTKKKKLILEIEPATYGSLIYMLYATIRVWLVSILIFICYYYAARRRYHTGTFTTVVAVKKK